MSLMSLILRLLKQIKRGEKIISLEDDLQAEYKLLTRIDRINVSTNARQSFRSKTDSTRPANVVIPLFNYFKFLIVSRRKSLFV